MEIHTDTEEMTVADLREALASPDISDSLKVRVALVDGKERHITPKFRVLSFGSADSGILVLEGSTGWV